MATEGTKFQVNFKLNDGTLINIYAADSAELEAQLATIQDSASLLNAVSGALNNASRYGAIAGAVGATSVASVTPIASAPSASVANANSCKHGSLVFRESKPGAPKAWKGWFCPSPKGTPDQCEPQFIR